jgi:hypothetical protein
MKSQFAFLCDSVNTTQSNLFNVLGGGIENMNFGQLPQTRPVALLIRIEYSDVTESGDHRVEIRLIDSDGRDKMPPAILNVNFPQGQRFFNFIATLMPLFDRYGTHSVEIAVDRHNIVSVPLNIIQQQR